MKKFQFSLDTVLDYKQQVLTSLQSEHGAILAQLHRQEQVLEQLEAQYHQARSNIVAVNKIGIRITKIPPMIFCA